MLVFLFDVDDKLTRVQPHEKIAVDERMVKSKHTFSGIRQFMKDKLLV
jgi:hypothetical protein